MGGVWAYNGHPMKMDFTPAVIGAALIVCLTPAEQASASTGMPAFAPAALKDAEDMDVDAEEAPDDVGDEGGDFGEDDAGKPAQAADSGEHEAPAQPADFDIEEYVQLAQENNPQVQAAKWELESYRKQLDEAHWAPYFNVSFNTMFTYMSRTEGDALYSPQGEFNISSDAGIWLRLELVAGVPIYTFGTITSYWDMAEQGVKVGKQKLLKEKQQVAYDVRRAYYSLQIARELLSVAKNGNKYLKHALDKVEEDLENDGGEFTDSDLLKLKTGKVKLEVQELQAKKIESISLAALRFLTGEPDLDPPDIPIEPEQIAVGELQQYLSAAEENRPELQMLGAAIKVGKANVKLKKASMLPNFILAGQYTYAYANKVEDQKTPFANDPFNKNVGGVVLMMEWPLDVVPGAFRISKAKADLFKLEAQQDYATGGISVEVELAYQDVIEAQERMKVLKNGKKLGKGWIIAESQSFDAGLTKIKDFVDALTTYFEMYMLFYQAVYDFNVSLAKLRLSAGTDDIAAQPGAGLHVE